MITIYLDDKKVVENIKAINELRKTGMYSEEELQNLYEKQVEKDKQAEKDKSEIERKETAL